jgi:hypothetical protein
MPGEQAAEVRPIYRKGDRVWWSHIICTFEWPNLQAF